MRTIKQLTVENEVLQKFSELIHQSSKSVFQFTNAVKLLKHFFLRMRRKYSMLSALAYGTYWGLDGYVLAALYWRTLILFEHDEIDSNRIIM
jgi:hypothetical protein